MLETQPMLLMVTTYVAGLSRCYHSPACGEIFSTVQSGRKILNSIAAAATLLLRGTMRCCSGLWGAEYLQTVLRSMDRAKNLCRFGTALGVGSVQWVEPWWEQLNRSALICREEGTHFCNTKHGSSLGWRRQIRDQPLFLAGGAVCN